jgi:catechol 2,3-dioxygenase-like lactoylglutathione lyase family enzyme
MNDATDRPPEPALKLKFISHGTLESRDIDFSRRFYEAFLGFETVRTSKISLMMRLGGEHVYAVVKGSAQREKMPLLNHNGIDVETDAEVDEAHRIVMRDAELWRLSDITAPIVQHGTYSFYFRDADGNCWEILSNPKGGYGWMFGRGDQEGRGHLSKDFARPVSP